MEREVTFPHSRIRLSHSTMEILDTCERKFVIERFYKGAVEETENVHFGFGKAWGAALQSYLLTQDLDAAIWAAYLNYVPMIEDNSKNLARLVNGIIHAQDELDKFLSKYELVSFHDKPAIELGVHINIDPVFYYVGFLDAVVRNKYSGRYSVVEGKSTGSQLHDISPMYRYSGQGTGYSITLDAIVGEEQAEFDVIYPVLQYPSKTGAEPKLQILTFEKNLLDRLKWFMTLQHDVNRIKTMFYLNHFPQRVNSCLKWNRPCPHFGVCQLVSIEDYKDEEPDPHAQDYQFHFELDDLIREHIRRVKDKEIKEIIDDTQVILLD